MAHTTQTVGLRRKREGRTNYQVRWRLLKVQKPRMVVRKSQRQVTAQLVVFDQQGDRVLLSASSKELQKKYGYKLHGSNIPAAYLVGFLLGKKAIQGKQKESILDIGLYPSTKGSRLYASLKGALDAGIQIPHDPAVLPTEERFLGKHIQAYLSNAKGKEQFTRYKKAGITDIPKHIAEVKDKIAGGT